MSVSSVALKATPARKVFATRSSRPVRSNTTFRVRAETYKVTLILKDKSEKTIEVSGKFCRKCFAVYERGRAAIHAQVFCSYHVFVFVSPFLVGAPCIMVGKYERGPTPLYLFSDGWGGADDVLSLLIMCDLHKF